MTEAAPEGLSYHRLHQGADWGPHGWWRALVGVPMFVLGMVLTGGVVGAVAVGLGYTIDTDDVTPSTLAFVNISLAVAIPVTWAVSRLVHGLSPRWLASVAPRIRWGWLVTCLGLALVALLATVVVSVVLPDQGAGEVGGEVNDFTSTTRDFLLIVLLLTPLQAAGEEYAFRGYLTQAFGGLTRHVWVAVAIPSLLFALAHGLGQSWPIFFDRLAFGLVAGTLVIVTGGLEAGIAMHVLNNWLAFSIALAYDDMSTALNPTGGTWWSIPVTLTQSLVYLGLAAFLGRRMGVQTRTRPGVLEASRGRV